MRRDRIGWAGFALAAACCLASVARAQARAVPTPTFSFPAGAVDDTAALREAMPRLAQAVLAAYRDPDGDRRRYLDALFRLQIVAGRYAEGIESLRALRALRAASGSPRDVAANAQYEIYARAADAERGPPSAAALRRAFRDVVGAMDDRTSALVMRALDIDTSALRRSVTGALQRQKGRSEIALADALALVRAYQVAWVYEALAPVTASLVAEDDQRRYVIDDAVPVRTPEGATVCTMVVRQRAAAGRLPALLGFTIYAVHAANLDEARRSASNGYAGVVGLSRGKECSPDAPVPYEHDGRDAAALIDWIAAQPWSDGRVGMYGGSYNGFTQWAAAKHLPKALRALMPSVTVAPGIDVPMDGNVFLSFVYPWPLYTATGKTLDDTTYNDAARWRRLNREWYASGRSYRSLDSIDGTPNPVFRRWLEHPTYDAYWQGMIPYGREEFARIDIPVLTTTGYYDGGQRGALHYFVHHYRYRPAAEHYLLVGPYDHGSGQRGTVTTLGDERNVVFGYEVDSAARIDLGEIRYQWFDHVLKGAPKPALLQDRVNYEVMGANEWKHAPSIAAMGERRVRFHLSAARAGELYRLDVRAPVGADASVAQTVNLADRSDVDRVSPASGNVADTVIDRWNGVAFASEPFAEPTEMSGLFSGRLAFVTNKKDFDFQVSLYELTPKGEYFQLAYYWSRASFVRDLRRRALLTPGVRQRLDFTSGRLTSRRFAKGSRLVVLLTLLKQPDTQIDYGTGKDVSDETIADAKEPLRVRWLGESWIEVPVSGGRSAVGVIRSGLR